MKVVLLLSVIGLAIYGAFVLTHDVLPNQSSERLQKAQNTNARLTRSWGSKLTALVAVRAPSIRSRPALEPLGSMPQEALSLAGGQVSSRQRSFLESKEASAIVPEVMSSSKKGSAAPIAKERTRSYAPPRVLRPVATFAESQTRDRKWTSRGNRHGPGLFFFRRFATSE
jgi:hypothetical protein